MFDIVGRRVQILLQKTQPPGDHEIVLDATPLSPGVYFVRMTSGRYTATRRLILTR
jgi:hypothetical protein